MDRIDMAILVLMGAFSCGAAVILTSDGLRFLGATLAYLCAFATLDFLLRQLIEEYKK